MATILRNKIADYLGKDNQIMFMGTGFNSLNEEPNAQTTQKTYINEVNSTTNITSYQPVFPYNSDLMKDEEAVYALYKTGRDRKTGVDAEFDYYRVDLFEERNGNHYPARKMRVSNEVSSFEGEGGQDITVSGNLNQVGDSIDGMFDVTTRNFIQMFKIELGTKGPATTVTAHIDVPVGYSLNYLTDAAPHTIPQSGAPLLGTTPLVGTVDTDVNAHVLIVLKDNGDNVVAFGMAEAV